MLSIELELAGKKDNSELLQLMNDMPMPGNIRVAFNRDPDFFKAQMVEGTQNQTLIGRDSKSGKIVGMGTRSIKQAYINDIKTNLGYLSSLRVLESQRGSIHLARGYEMLRKLHNDGATHLYLSTMLNDNAVARTLTKSRARLPKYHDIGQYVTMAISLSQTPKSHTNDGIIIRAATEADLSTLVAFLNTEGKQRQFFPAYEEKDFFNESGLLVGLKPEDILLAFDGHLLKGVMAAWDQKSFRRSVVAGYSKGMTFSRPAYNLWAQLAKMPKLPIPGSVLNYRYMALLCIQDDNEDVCRALQGKLMEHNRGKCSFIMAGLHEADPLLPVLSRFGHITYLSRLYVVCWQDGEEAFAKLNGKTPYLELGSL